MVLVPTEAEARDGGGISVAVGPNGDVTAAAGAAAARGGWQPLPPLPTYSGAAVAAVRRVSLRPGELLYIPPYHPHAVYGDAPSVSLASFSDSWEQVRCLYPPTRTLHLHACLLACVLACFTTLVAPRACPIQTCMLSLPSMRACPFPLLFRLV